jgi:hypothetical protein
LHWKSSKFDLKSSVFNGFDGWKSVLQREILGVGQGWTGLDCNTVDEMCGCECGNVVCLQCFCEFDAVDDAV